MEQEITGKTYFTSDYHLGHQNVIKYDKRPFSSVGEMNETILKNAEKQLKPGDTLYFLGDFSFAKYEQTEHWLKRLAACMLWNYELIEFAEVEKKMKKKTFKPIDHHGKRDGDKR